MGKVRSLDFLGIYFRTRTSPDSWKAKTEQPAEVRGFLVRQKQGRFGVWLIRVAFLWDGFLDVFIMLKLVNLSVPNKKPLDDSRRCLFFAKEFQTTSL